MVLPRAGLLLVACAIFGAPRVAGVSLEQQQRQLQDLAAQLKTLRASVHEERSSLREAVSTVSMLTRQMMLQQLYLSERVRSDGNSGVKRTRTRSSGTHPFHSESHTGQSTCSIHDHSNYIRTVGMGEFIGVLNGVEFRTRHNDYKLVMPHRSLHGASKEGFHAVQDIPLPQVPPQVLKQTSVDKQVAEMREWFKAWRDSNHTVRDYRQYFKPVLCYLEGAWMADAEKFDESFPSDRHSLAASSWFDLQEKIRFTSDTGRKHNMENFAYLPTSIAGTIKKGNLTIPVMAQWNYRILCHPVKKHIPLHMLRPIDDLAMRMGWGRKWSELYTQRATRFQLNVRNTTYWRDTMERNTVLNSIMNEIPGKDNYPGNLTDTAFGYRALKMQATNEVINAAYYHNWYKIDKKDAMGVSVAHRGFHDESIYMAMTSSPKVAPSQLNDCVKRWNPETKRKEKQCSVYTQRYTYAIPLELIYLTPLSTWNPHNVALKGRFNDRKNLWWQTVTADGRNGGLTKEKAFNGTNSKFHYLTPVDFFNGKEVDKDKADTVKRSAGVLDKNGVMRAMTASGTRILLPNIPEVGVIRQRYPIFPLHEDGLTVMKEVAALKELILEPQRHANMLRHGRNGGGDSDKDQTVTVRLRPSQKSRHTHDVLLSPEEVADMQSGRTVQKQSEEENSHTHFLQMAYNFKLQKYFYKKCDNANICHDKHSRTMDVITNDAEDIA